ncbi:MAG: M1 family aminopeptidase [Flavobacteriales bacterium]
MITRLFLFEVRNWLKQPMVYIFMALFAFFCGAAVAVDNFRIGGAIGSVHRNSPSVLYTFYSIMCILSLLVVTAIVNATAIRDFANNTSQIVFSTAITKRQYLLSKFLASTFVATIPLMGVSLGFVIGSATPWPDPEQIGPNQLLPHLQAFLLLALPNVVFISAVIFAVAVLMRTTMASFVSAIVLLVGYIVAQNLSSDLDNRTVVALLDPFGIRAVSLATKYWTVQEKNTLLLPMNGLLVGNRVLWLSVSTVVFLYAYLRFSFSDRRQKVRAEVAEGASIPIFQQRPLPKVNKVFGTRTYLAQFARQVRLDLVGIIKGTVFIIVMLLGLAELFTSLAYVTELYDNTGYPVTYNVIETIEGSFYIYLIIIITFYTGALIWKERDPKMDEIHDALPTPSWRDLLAKACTIMLLIFLIHVLAVGAGMLTQALHGYTRFEPDVYLGYFVIPGTLKFSFLAMLALFIHTLVNNKYIGYFAFIVLVVLNTFGWSGLDVESNLLIMNSTGNMQYSDMARFGPFLKGWSWFMAYWWAFGGILLFVAFLFWVRGKETSARWRLRNAMQRLRTSWKVALPLVGIWVVLGGWGYYNSKVLNTYTTSDQVEDAQADYEKLYKRFEHTVQPHYTDLVFTIDIDPYKRSLKTRAEVTLLNKSAQAIDSLHLNLPQTIALQIDVPNSALVLNDTVRNYRIYRLGSPLQPGASLHLVVSSNYAARGFENSVRLVQLVENGTFFNNMDILPSIGYDPGSELTDRSDRRKHQLPQYKERMPKLSDDPARRMDTYLMKNSDWVNVRTTISTSVDQVAVAPGSLRKEWTADGRHYFEYELDHPSMNFYSFLSARYEVAREKWNDIDVEVYYHKDHAVNVPRMINSMKKALTYYTTHFGPYYHKQVRILEFPRYFTFAQAFPGTMPYSESIGFITDLTADDDIDMVFYVVAHEMGHQWWAHQLVGANMQGATLLSESMAQYSALMVMEKEYGRDHMRKFLKLESDKYQRSRGTESLKEVPLLEVENQGYIHYNKASVVMYCMREFLGEDTLDQAFKRLIDRYAYQQPPYPTALDMYREIDRVTPDSLTYLLEDNFKYITLYNNRLMNAKGRMLPDSSYDVTVTFTAEKNHADTLGRETPVAMNDWIDVGFFSEPPPGKDDGELLYKKRERVVTGENTFTYHLPKQPYQAAVDPDHLFFDRVPEDNVKKVEFD